MDSAIFFQETMMMPHLSTSPETSTLLYKRSAKLSCVVRVVVGRYVKPGCKHSSIVPELWQLSFARGKCHVLFFPYGGHYVSICASLL